ncbi:MAG: EamA family transporter [Acidobacteriaceae bacterium]
MIGWLALGGSILLGSSAQIFLKRGVSSAPGKRVFHGYLSPWVLAWGISFVVATVLWLTALAHIDISYAYPLLGVGYVLVVLLAAFFLNERISSRRWLAMLIIAAGAVIVARSR